MQTKDGVFLALDGMPYEKCPSLLKKLIKRIKGVKIHELFYREGLSVIAQLHSLGVELVWVDTKFHDTPGTVRSCAKILAEWGCDMISVHASGGCEMIQAARMGFGDKGQILAVTVPTSLEPLDVLETYNDSVESVVVKLAEQAFTSGCVNGFTASGLEIGLLANNRKYRGLKFIVPGVRSAGVPKDDQQRVVTPWTAVANGANLIVVGRQITLAPNPVVAFDELEKELNPAAST